MAIRIQLRRDLSTNWSETNPLLYPGEFGIETDTNKIKVGPPVTAPDYGTHWNSITTYLNITPQGLENSLNDYIPNADLGNPGGPAKLDVDGNLLVPKSSIIIEGATDNSYETTLTVTDPTSDRTITFPDASGTVALVENISELSQDAIDDALSPANGINKSYDDAANKITLSVDTSVISTKTYAQGLVSTEASSRATAVSNAITTAENYTDSAISTEVTNRNSAISTEISNRNSAIATAKSQAITTSETYTDDKISSEVTSRNSAISTAKSEAISISESYTDGKISTEITARNNAVQNAIETAEQYTTDAITAVHGTITTEIANAKSQAISTSEGYTDTAITNLVNAAPAALNTLKELADAINDDASFASTVTTNIATKVAKAGDTMTGNLAFGGTHKVTGLAAPADPGDSATKGYVDDTKTDLNAAITNISNALTYFETQVGNEYAPKSSPTINNATFTGTTYGITKSMVGLSNVDNTSDANKSLSTAAIAALALKQDKISGVSDTEISYLDGVTSGIQSQIDSKLSTSLAASTYQTLVPNVSNTEIGYLDGVTSSIQNQLDYQEQQISVKQDKVANVSDSEIGYLDGVTSSIQTQINDKQTQINNKQDKVTNVSDSEIGYLDGVTSPIQTQLNDKQTQINNKQDKVANVSDSEIGYLDGVTSSIQTQLDSKSPLDSPIFTGTVGLPSTTSIGDVSNIELSYLNNVTSPIQTQLNEKQATINNASSIEIGYLAGTTASIQGQLNTKAPLQSPTFTGTVSGITKGMVGLGNVDNTSDANKPVSTATQTALDLKAPLASPTFTGTVILPTGTVTSGMILDGTIINNDISSSAAIAYSKLNLSGSIVSSDITDGAIATVDLADSVITTAKIADSAITSAKIADGTIVAADIADGAITSAKILDGTIVNGDISSSAAIAYSKLNLASSITSADIVDGTIVNGDISSSAAIATSKISGLDTTLAAKAPLASPTFTGTVNTADLIITGNLTVTGTSTTISSTDLKVDDSLIYLADNNTTSDALEIGFFGAYKGSGDSTHKHTGLVRDHADAKWKLVTGMAEPSSTNMDFTSATYGVLKAATFEGNVTGAVTGNADTATKLATASNINGVAFDGSAAITVKASTTNALTIGTGLSGSSFDGSGAITIAIDSTVATLTESQTLTNKTLTSPIITLPSGGITFSDGTIQTTTGVQSLTPINVKTSDYTLSSLTERDTLIEINSSNPVTVTIPLNSSTAYPIGTSIDILATNTGQVTIAGASGVTVNYTPGLKLRTQWSSCTLFKRDTNSWVVYGDLKA